MPDLVAYLDGELSERDHGRVAAAVEDSSRLRSEVARFKRVGSLVAELERVTPSSAFADTFWQRLEREGRIEHESQLARWHRKWSEWHAWFIAGEGWKEWLGGGYWAPALVPAASLLIILATLFSGTLSTLPLQPTQQLTRSEQIRPQVVKNAAFFRDYWLTARLERWVYFDEIMQTQIPRPLSTLAHDQVPPKVVENPNFFMHYQILRRMEQFQHFESVQSVSFDRADRRQG